MAGVNISKKKAYDLIEIKKKHVSPLKEVKEDFYVDTKKKLPLAMVKGLRTDRHSIDVNMSTMELKEDQRLKVAAS